MNLAVHPGTGTPNVLRWGSLCYDAYNKEIVLFGGGAMDKPFGTPGTWTFKSTTRTWTDLKLSVQPSPRGYSPMVYDPVNRCIVLFGGDRMNALLNDTWVYDCVTRSWSKKNPAIRPRPVGGHALIYLPKSGKIVLLGGYRYDIIKAWGSGTTEFEVWTYDVAANTWGLVKHMSGAETWPQLREMGPTLSGFMAANQGDTIVSLSDSVPAQYYYTPATMRMACDPTLIDISGTNTYGITHDSVVIRSGSYDPNWYTQGILQPDTGANEAALRNLPLSGWTKLSPPKTPGGDRTWGTVVLDPSRDLLMRWGGGHAAYYGTDVPHYSLHNNRWTIGYAPEIPFEYNGSYETWPGPFTFNDRPFMAVHPVKSTAYDPTSRLMIHFSNKYTYLYNPDSMDWVKGVRILSPFQTSNPMASYYAGLCSTPHGVYGSWGDAGSFLFNSDSLKWRKLPQTGTLPSYFADECGAVYDSKRDRILHFNRGHGETPVPVFECVFSTGQATQLVPSSADLPSPTNKNYRDCVYLPNLDIVLFPIRRDNSNLAYDCANNRWVQIPVQGFIKGMDDVGTAMAYDAKRNLVWLTNAGSALYALRLDSATTRLELDRTAKETAILTVSPNPFNPTTFIHLPKNSIALKSTDVSLRVLAVDGRCVADLSRQAAVGTKVAWLANGLSSGIYYIQYRVDKKVWQTKAILVR
ncbi:MAG: hypothetical protein JNL74_22610 [Fibrobacteres bacterium]|nr:hypothetical protein [Fibrobacterota bacterium]